MVRFFLAAADAFLMFLSVERRDVLRVEEHDQLARDHVTLGLLGLHLFLRDAGVRVLAKTPLDEP